MHIPADGRLLAPVRLTAEAGLAPGAAVLLLLIATDAAFATLHLAATGGLVGPNPLYELGRDRGYAEVFQYCKFAWGALYAGLLAIARRPRPLYLAFAMLFAYAAVDDALMVHERLGDSLAVTLALPAVLGLRPEDLGELLVFTVAAIPVALMGALGYARAAPGQRAFARRALLFVSVLAAFAVGVDLLHIAVAGLDSAAEPYWQLVEDGGEMVAASLLVAHVLAHGSRQRPR